MRCTKCGFENPAGMKFCGKCRTALGLTCPNCSFENPPGFDFCGQCATALQADTGIAKGKSAPPKPSAAIRIAAEQADASAVRGRAQDGHGAVRRHQGLDRVDGGPRSRRGARDHRSGAEADDRRGASLRRLRRAIDRRRHLRAVRRAGRARGPSAARALRGAAHAGGAETLFGQSGCAEGGTPIQGRVGVNTGEVVVRSIQTGAGQIEYTPIGHTTNLASRMQTAAPVGSIAVSEATRRLCEGYFALEAAGRDQSQRRQRAGQRLRSDRARAAAHAVAALGGARADEVRRARARDGGAEARRRAGARRARTDRRGDGGAGRRQVAAVLRVQGDESQSGWMVLETFSISHGKASAYLPVLDLLARLFQNRGRRR